jgi:hypothetical protein
MYRAGQLQRHWSQKTLAVPSLRRYAPVLQILPSPFTASAGPRTLSLVSHWCVRVPVSSVVLPLSSHEFLSHRLLNSCWLQSCFRLCACVCVSCSVCVCVCVSLSLSLSLFGNEQCGNLWSAKMQSRSVSATTKVPSATAPEAD